MSLLVGGQNEHLTLTWTSYNKLGQAFLHVNKGKGGKQYPLSIDFAGVSLHCRSANSTMRKLKPF